MVCFLCDFAYNVMCDMTGHLYSTSFGCALRSTHTMITLYRKWVVLRPEVFLSLPLINIYLKYIKLFLLLTFVVAVCKV